MHGGLVVLIAVDELAKAVRRQKRGDVGRGSPALVGEHRPVRQKRPATAKLPCDDAEAGVEGNKLSAHLVEASPQCAHTGILATEPAVELRHRRLQGVALEGEVIAALAQRGGLAVGRSVAAAHASFPAAKGVKARPRARGHRQGQAPHADAHTQPHGENPRARGGQGGENKRSHRATGVTRGLPRASVIRAKGRSTRYLCSEKSSILWPPTAMASIRSARGEPSMATK